MNFNTNLRITRSTGGTSAGGRPLTGAASRATVYAKVPVRLEPLSFNVAQQGDKQSAAITDRAIARNRWDIRAYDSAEDLVTGLVYKVVSVKKYGRSQMVLNLEAKK